MSRLTKHYAFIFMNQEHFADVNYTEGRTTNFEGLEYERIKQAEYLVHASTIRTNRKEPQEIAVACYEIKLVKGQPERAKHPIILQVMPYKQELTEETYKQEMAEILDEIPREFHAFICNEARGKDNLEEGLQYAEHLVHELQNPIRQFQASICQPD